MVGPYAILEEIGRGGMGCVYRARGPEGQIVALKVLNASLHNNPVERNRFQREADLAKRLDHPNLIKALDFGEADGQHYFAMEYVDGESLGKHVGRVGKLREEDAIRIIVAVSQGLAVAHGKGLIHRDIKPENILLTLDGQVKLVDLGLAKELDGDLTLTQPDRGLGTPIFMAPEQFRNASQSDTRCDIYALGQTLYVMVTGKLPFPSGSSMVDTFLKKSKSDFVSPDRICPNLRLSTLRTIRQSMLPDPEHRPRDVQAFVNMLLGRSIASGLSNTSSSEIDAPEPPTRHLSDEIQKIYSEDSGPRATRKDGHTSDNRPISMEEVREQHSTAIDEEFNEHPWVWLDTGLMLALSGIVAAAAISGLGYWLFKK